MKYGKDVKKQANELILAIYKAEFLPEGVSLFQNIESLYRMIQLAKSHHTLQEAHCNQGLTPRQETREKNIEQEIKEIASRFSLRVKFDGDPRGYTVKLHSPKGNLWNTWGGETTGYGIG